MVAAIISIALTPEAILNCPEMLAMRILNHQTSTNTQVNSVADRAATPATMTTARPNLEPVPLMFAGRVESCGVVRYGSLSSLEAAGIQVVLPHGKDFTARDLMVSWWGTDFLCFVERVGQLPDGGDDVQEVVDSIRLCELQLRVTFSKAETCRNKLIEWLQAPGIILKAILFEMKYYRGSLISRIDNAHDAPQRQYPS
jgi:hypothetical protein